MYLRSKRPENAVSVLTSAIAANINIQLGLFHSIQGPPSNYRNLGRVNPAHPLFLAANMKANIYPSACWSSRSESTLQQAAGVPASSLSCWTRPFSTPWTNNDSPSIFFSPLPPSRRRNAFGQEQSRMETMYCDHQEKNDGTSKARVGLPNGILDVILDPEENTITTTKAKVWFDDERLVFKTPSPSTSGGAGREPGWKLSEIRRAATTAAAEAAAAAKARRAQRTSPPTSLTLTQSSEDTVDGNAHPRLSLSCMLINWFQDRTLDLPFGTIPPSNKPISVSGHEPKIAGSHRFQEPHTDPSSRLVSARTTASDPSFITWSRSDLHCRPRPPPSQPPIGTPALRCPSNMRDVKNAAPLGPEPQSWNEESSDSESDDDNDDDDDDDDDDGTIADDDLKESGLPFGSAKSSRSNSAVSSFDIGQDPLQCTRTKMYNAEQTSRLELVVIEQLLQRLSTQIRHEESEPTSFFWAWP